MLPVGCNYKAKTGTELITGNLQNVRDGNTFIGYVNDSRDTIPGMVYSGDQEELVPEDRLVFINAIIPLFI